MLNEEMQLKLLDAAVLHMIIYFSFVIWHTVPPFECPLFGMVYVLDCSI